eukprot:6877543-Alexandrium_andersonii.AAC.1
MVPSSGRVGSLAGIVTCTVGGRSLPMNIFFQRSRWQFDGYLPQLPMDANSSTLGCDNPSAWAPASRYCKEVEDKKPNEYSSRHRSTSTLS